jgi:hypothetical protein
VPPGGPSPGPRVPLPCKGPPPCVGISGSRSRDPQFGGLEVLCELLVGFKLGAELGGVDPTFSASSLATKKAKVAWLFLPSGLVWLRSRCFSLRV